MKRYEFLLIVLLLVVAGGAVAIVAYNAGSNAAAPPPAGDVASRIAAAQGVPAETGGTAPWLLISAILLISLVVAGAFLFRQYGEAERQRRLSKRRQQPYRNGHRPVTTHPQLPAPQEGEYDE